MIQRANSVISVTIPTTYGWFNNAQVGETLTIASTGSAYSNAIYDIREYLNISNNDTDWSHYDVEILIDSAIAREYEVNEYCQYSFVNLSDPMHIWQQVGVQKRWKTTLDRIMNKTMTIFIQFKGHN